MGFVAEAPCMPGEDEIRYCDGFSYIGLLRGDLNGAKSATLKYTL